MGVTNYLLTGMILQVASGRFIGICYTKSVIVPTIDCHPGLGVFWAQKMEVWKMISVFRTADFQVPAHFFQKKMPKHFEG